MPHKNMTESEWRDFVCKELAAGKHRFEELERGHRTMRLAIAENTTITKATDNKVDQYILEARELGNKRHQENIDRFGSADRKLIAAATNAAQAKTSADEMVKKLDGVVKIWEGGKMVKGFAISAKTALLGTATVLASVCVIVGSVLYLLGRGQLPPFPH